MKEEEEGYEDPEEEEEDEKNSFYLDHENKSEQELLIDMLYELQRITNSIRMLNVELQSLKLKLNR